MDVTNTIGAGELVRKYPESDDGHDLLAEMVKMAAELLMDAEVDVLSGASYGERTENEMKLSWEQFPMTNTGIRVLPKSL